MSIILLTYSQVEIQVCVRAIKMAAGGVAGYRQILESLESPARWKEKTLQAG